MAINNIQITDKSIKGTITVEIPFEIKAKRKRMCSAGFAGHTDICDGDENITEKLIAQAWPQSGGCRIYFKRDKDDIVVNYNDEDTLNYEYMKELLDFANSQPEMQKIIDKFNQSEEDAEKKRKEEQLEQARIAEENEIQRLEKELKDLEEQEKAMQS